jgi:hypothetical protein
VSRALLHTPIRRAHLIAPFGPGALLLTRNRVSAITCAPATWMRSLPIRAPGSVPVLDELTITDRHLQAYLGVDRFIVPWAPSSDDPNKDVDWLVPAARFPLAEYCANPDCQRLTHRSLADANEGRCNACASSGTQRGRWPTFQVPVVLACQAGHLADVPWPEWLHRWPGVSCDRPDVRYRPGTTADRPSLRCGSCKRTATFGPDTTFPCPGQRPWLPHADPEPCTLMARPVERTSTAAYYPCQLSSLTIPVAGADNPLLTHALTDNAVLRALRALPRITALTEMVAAAARIGIKTDEAELSRHLDALEQPPESGPRRADELSALTSTSHPRRPRTALPDLVVEPQDVAAYRGTRLGDRIAAVSLVPRLRETRVLAGFSRIEPTPADPDAGYRQLWGKPRPGQFAEHAADNWLPGYQVFGEGILLVLDPGTVAAWEAKAAGNARLEAAATRMVRQLEPVRPLPWLLAHTLAHLIMRAAAPQAGYPLPALRERIYATDQRTAALIYTAAGDVQGTLGGLVELGSPDRLSRILEETVEAASWCATDPICAEDSPGPRGNGSTPGACHHCLLLPETCCESFNRGLDRLVLLGGQTIPGFLTQ